MSVFTNFHVILPYFKRNVPKSGVFRGNKTFITLESKNNKEYIYITDVIEGGLKNGIGRCIGNLDC
jgi:hypothetical protein